MTTANIHLEHKSSGRGYIAGVWGYNSRDKTYTITATTVTAVWYPFTATVYPANGSSVQLLVNGVSGTNWAGNSLDKLTYQQLIPQETLDNGTNWGTTGTYTLLGKPIISPLTGHWLMAKHIGPATATLLTWQNSVPVDVMPVISETNHLLFNENTGAPVDGVISLVW